MYRSHIHLVDLNEINQFDYYHFSNGYYSVDSLSSFYVC